MGWNPSKNNRSFIGLCWIFFGRGGLLVRHVRVRGGSVGTKGLPQLVEGHYSGLVQIARSASMYWGRDLSRTVMRMREHWDGCPSVLLFVVECPKIRLAPVYNCAYNQHCWPANGIPIRQSQIRKSMVSGSQMPCPFLRMKMPSPSKTSMKPKAASSPLAEIFYWGF